MLIAKHGDRPGDDPDAGSRRTDGGAPLPDSSPLERKKAEFDAESIQMVVRRKTPRLTGCIERISKKGLVVSGLVEVRFTLGADGKVTKADVHRNTTGYAQLGRCIAAELARWRFPRPVGGSADFIYPFLLSSRK
jgi:hypothetical protein